MGKYIGTLDKVVPGAVPTPIDWSNYYSCSAGSDSNCADICTNILTAFLKGVRSPEGNPSDLRF
ncbi:MAG: hypothetical protein NPIRA03_21940 [Nitrospirales bacterium]|nr:MAG: hypothetical protein NPIRA03_21940 [Nitrospirales bacterium]